MLQPFTTGQTTLLPWSLTSGGIPDPGLGTAPPGSAGFLTILAWAAWIAFGVCVLGIIVSGATMALASRRGEGGEHATRLGWVMAGAILIGSASGFVGILAGK